MRGTHLLHWLFKARFFGPHAARKSKLIALSFDDGPHPRYTHQVLKILNEYGVQATFFWIAEVAQRLKEDDGPIFEKMLAMIREGGHEIGLHALYDCELSLPMRLFGQHSKEELLQGKQILEELTSLPVRLYRPHGVQAGSSIDHASELGLTTVCGIPFTTVHGIPGIPGYFFPSVLPGSILILHDGARNGWKSASVTEVLPLILEQLTQRGLRQSSVSHLLQVGSVAA